MQRTLSPTEVSLQLLPSSGIKQWGSLCLGLPLLSMAELSATRVAARHFTRRKTAFLPISVTVSLYASTLHCGHGILIRRKCCREKSLLLLIHRKQILTEYKRLASKGSNSMGSSESSPNQAFLLFCHVFSNFPQGLSDSSVIHGTWSQPLVAPFCAPLTSSLES